MGTLTGAPLNLTKPASGETGWAGDMNDNLQALNDRFSEITEGQIFVQGSDGDPEGEAKNTAFNKNFGTGTSNVPQIGSTLVASKTVETDADGKLKTADKGTAYNKDFGTSSGDVAEGDHTHDSRYYTETEIDALISSIISDISSDTISSDPFNESYNGNGVTLNFVQFTHSGEVILGHYAVQWAYDSAEPTWTGISAVRNVQGGASTTFGFPSTEGDSLWLRIKFVSIGGYETSYYTTELDGFDSDNEITVAKIVTQLLEDSDFVADLRSELAANPLTAAKVAANMKSVLSDAGSPIGSVTPDFIGQEYWDETNSKWYKAYGTTNSAWSALN